MLTIIILCLPFISNTHGFSLSDELNSEKFYKYLNNLTISTECNKYCESLRTREKRGSVKNICARTLSYLKDKYSTPDNKKDEYDVCTLLNYWVYSRLDMAYGYKEDSELHTPFADLQGVWYDFIEKKLDKRNNKICQPINNIPAQYDWKKRRELLDYCSDVNDLVKTAQTHTSTCNKYYQYIKSKTELYKQYKQACSDSDTSMCPEFFDKCKDYDPEIMLHKLNCPLEMDKTKAAASEVSMHGDQANHVSQVSETAPGVVPKLQRGNTGMVSNFGNLLLGVVVTSMTSGAIYRFTPFGRRLRNGFGWSNNNMRNAHGGEYGLFDYASESYNPYSGGGEQHYIAYHPAQ